MILRSFGRVQGTGELEELTAAGVTFPVHARYFVAGGNQTTLDSANVLKQAFSDSFGDDFIVLDIDSYVSSLSKEVRDPRRQSFVINRMGQLTTVIRRTT